MKLTSKLLEQIAFNTRPKIEEHMLIVMEKSTHTEHLFEPLQTNNKQFKIAITFVTAYNGIFNITSKNNKFCFLKSIIDDNHFQNNTIPQGAYEIQSLNKEIKRIIIDEGHFTPQEYPFTIKSNFTTLGFIFEKSNEESAISFIPDDSIRNLLGFKRTSIYEKYKKSPNPVDIISFDNIFIESNIAQGVIFKGRKSGVIHNFTMKVNPGYEYVERFENLVSFNGQSITFRISIKEV